MSLLMAACKLILKRSKDFAAPTPDLVEDREQGRDVELFDVRPREASNCSRRAAKLPNIT